MVENSIEIYPNPATSSIVLSNKKSAFSADDKFQIYNITGKKIYTSNIIAKETNIDVSSYAKGLYLLVSSINGQVNNWESIIKSANNY